jgi:Mlc titration factor MtfA (ptsG expression regulator)
MGLIRHMLDRLVAGRTVVLPTAPTPPSWPAILDRWVPLSTRLADADQVRLMRLTQLFIRDVPMEGCGGLELTEEIRVTIAATASLLLLHLPYPRFPRLRRVLVYADTFVPRRVQSPMSQAMPEAPVGELGEAWPDGMVVLSWSDIKAGGVNPGDGHNVILHEFAHILDYESGPADGQPVLDSEAARTAWHEVFTAEFAREQAAVDHAGATVLDPYAATNLAEFFAVATETFFEQGGQLRTRSPLLYEQLRLFYRQDPASLAGSTEPRPEV